MPIIISLSVSKNKPSRALLSPPTQVHLSSSWSIKTALNTEIVPIVPKNSVAKSNTMALARNHQHTGQPLGNRIKYARRRPLGQLP